MVDLDSLYSFVAVASSTLLTADITVLLLAPSLIQLVPAARLPKTDAHYKAYNLDRHFKTLSYTVWILTASLVGSVVGGLVGSWWIVLATLGILIVGILVMISVVYAIAESIRELALSSARSTPPSP